MNKNNENTLPQPLEYDKLKAYGIEYIQKIGSKHWTDFNVHDPGVTILETLCFALTDLGYRTSFATRDLLTRKGENAIVLDGSLFPPHKVFPSSPITTEDYRKYILECVPGVKNIWFKETDITYPLKSIFGVKEKNVKLKGQYEVTVELENKLFLHTEYIRRIVGRNWKGRYSDNYYEEEGEGCYKQCFKHYIKNMLLKRRNLCEDFYKVNILEPIEVGICAHIELTPYTDEAKILQQIYDTVENYISPSLPYHTTAEMLAKGRSLEDLYQTITPRYGFIDAEELKNYQKNHKLDNSDVIDRLMKIEGVKSIKHFQFMVDSAHERIMDFGSSHLKLPNDKYCFQFTNEFTFKENINDHSKLKNRVCFIHHNYTDLPSRCEITPRLSSRFPLDIVLGSMQDDKEDNGTNENSKNLVQIKTDQFKEYQFGDRKITYKTIIDKDISPDFTVETEPIAGRYRNTDKYVSFQNFFPKAYHLGIDELPNHATDLQKAEQKQLKAYLCFFDHILSGYLRQLDSVKDYFGLEDKENYNISEPFLKGLTNNEIRDLNQLLFEWNDKENSLSEERTRKRIEHSNRLIEHLLSRFGESFSDYAALSFFLGEDVLSAKMVNDKKQFLRSYYNESSIRSQAIDYTEDLTTSGIERRILHKLGIPHPELQKDLAPDLIRIEYYNGKGEPVKEETENKRFIFHDNRQNTSSESDILHYQQNFGLHIIEHSLLVPINGITDSCFLHLYEDDEMKTYLEDQEECVPDPYSFRVTVVLPGWLNVCQSPAFRTWLENTSR